MTVPTTLMPSTTIDLPKTFLWRATRQPAPVPVLRYCSILLRRLHNETNRIRSDTARRARSVGRSVLAHTGPVSS